MALPMMHHRFTADEYERMIAVGILTKYHHVELIRGEIIAMQPIGPPHAFCSMMLSDLLVPSVRGGLRVAVRSPLRISDESVPQPDVALLRFASYSDAYPRAGDVHLVIEIADTTRTYDYDVKMPMYAAAGIPEAWLTDLTENRVERHTGPGANFYRQVVRYWGDDIVTSTIVPNIAIPVDTMLGLDE